MDATKGAEEVPESSGAVVEHVNDEREIAEIEYSQSSNDESDSDENMPKALSVAASQFQKYKPPAFGHVSMSHSENVQFGNKTYFNGPVTINQVMQSNSGMENPSYLSSNTHEARNEVSQERILKRDEPSSKATGLRRWRHLLIVLTGIPGLVIVACSTFISTTIDIATDNIPDSHLLVENGMYQGYDCNTKTLCINPLVVVSLNLLLSLTVVIPLTTCLTAYTLTNFKRQGNCNSRRQTQSPSNQDNPTQQPNTNSVYYIKGKPMIIAPNHLRIVPRWDWLAQPETGILDKMKLPVPWVVITHTATGSCHNQSECVYRVRLIQNYHVESRGWYYIGYNFLVGGDGSAYYGRGWDYVGAHTKGYNIYSIAIAFIGTFSLEAPPRQQLDACKKLIKMGVDLGKLSKDYKLLAHRQLMSTTSPGDKLYDIIKTWPHFVHNISDLEETLASY